MSQYRCNFISAYFSVKSPAKTTMVADFLSILSLPGFRSRAIESNFHNTLYSTTHLKCPCLHCHILQRMQECKGCTAATRALCDLTLCVIQAIQHCKEVATLVCNREPFQHFAKSTVDLTQVYFATLTCASQFCSGGHIVELALLLMRCPLVVALYGALSPCGARACSAMAGRGFIRGETRRKSQVCSESEVCNSALALPWASESGA